MPIGSTALDPNTEYKVYEFWFNGRVFYVGHSWGNIRHAKRWGHVKNLLKHEAAGTLTASKARDLNTPNNRVIAALITRKLPEYTVQVHWSGRGKANAEPIEKQRIRELLGHGCVLANIKDNPSPASVHKVLKYLGVTIAA